MWSAAFSGLPDAATTYLSAHLFKPDTAFTSLESWLLLVATVLVSMLGLVALQAVVARHAVRDDTGGRAPFGGLNDYLTLVALGLVTTLGTVAGFILLIIPGVVLSLAWVVVVPAMVTERLGVMNSIRRSNALTENARGDIFGLLVAIGLVGWLAAWLVTLITDALDIAFVNLIASPALQTLTGLFSATVAVAIYQELRVNKEGTSTDRLVKVFA
ncbi:hypothetical protein ASD38_10935 [Caulobacter sp. Root487D2Y]|nr:hypothetical protein ASD38_10935 [Caulobacter sp. Root487D2Y]